MNFTNILKTAKSGALCLVLLMFEGCGGSEIRSALHPTEAKIPTRDDWLLTGKIADPSFANGEALALGINGDRLRTVINNQLVFGLELPGKSTYAIYFLAPSIDNEAGRQVISKAALFHFNDSPDIGLRDTLRLPSPKGTGILNLGEVDILGTKALSSINPAAQLDYDQDGLPDIADLDDENNGISDLEEKNVTESLVICHIKKDEDASRPSSMRIQLSQLLDHLAHGDGIGKCPLPQAKIN